MGYTIDAIAKENLSRRFRRRHREEESMMEQNGLQNPKEPQESEAATGAKTASTAPQQAACPCCCGRTRQRSPEEYKALMNRLNRIEGQVKGLKRMLENDTYCPDILTQVSAVNSALGSFARELLSQHIRTCVKDDILAGNDETLDELMDTLRKFMK